MKPGWMSCQWTTIFRAWWVPCWFLGIGTQRTLRRCGRTSCSLTAAPCLVGLRGPIPAPTFRVSFVKGGRAPNSASLQIHVPLRMAQRAWIKGLPLQWRCRAELMPRTSSCGSAGVLRRNQLDNQQEVRLTHGRLCSFVHSRRISTKPVIMRLVCLFIPTPARNGLRLLWQLRAAQRIEAAARIAALGPCGSVNLSWARSP